jgi:hypothetical protein
LNQFSHGVVAYGTNGGGPDPNGMRNIINLDRGDAGYSPLWLIMWMTELPMNYLADQATTSTELYATENGFDMVQTPMFINCPDIGNVGSEVMEPYSMEYDTTIKLANTNNIIQGSHMSLIMQGGIAVTFETSTSNGVMIGSVETNMMGAYEYDLATADIPEGTTEIQVKVDGEVIRTIEVTDNRDDDETDDKTDDNTTDPTSAGSVFLSKSSSIAVFLGLVALVRLLM